MRREGAFRRRRGRRGVCLALRRKGGIWFHGGERISHEARIPLRRGGALGGGGLRGRLRHGFLGLGRQWQAGRGRGPVRGCGGLRRPQRRPHRRGGAFFPPRRPPQGALRLALGARRRARGAPLDPRQGAGRRLRLCAHPLGARGEGGAHLHPHLGHGDVRRGATPLPRDGRGAAGSGAAGAGRLRHPHRRHLL